MQTTTANRGDLAIIATRKEVTNGRPRRQYDIVRVTAVHPDGTIKNIQRLARRGAPNRTRPEPIDRLPRHEVVLLSADRLNVREASTAILDRRADPDTGAVPTYTHIVEVLRDLNKWTVDDGSCLAIIRFAAYNEVQDNYQDQRCISCGFTLHGNGRIITDDDGCPAPQCRPACPIGVNFTTNFPIGLKVRIIDGHSAGYEGTVEDVNDSRCSETDDGPTYYSGRSYSLVVPRWGYRQFPETFIEAVDPADQQRYAVPRETPTS